MLNYCLAPKVRDVLCSRDEQWGGTLPRLPQGVGTVGEVRGNGT